MKKRSSFVMPAIENDFLGYGSFEAFILNHQDKFEDDAKKGAFKILVELQPNEFDEDGSSSPRFVAFFIIKDIRVEDGDLTFFYLQQYPENSTTFDSEGSHLRQRAAGENMLHYFDNIQTEINGYWVECTLAAPLMIRIVGQFQYRGNELVDTENKFACLYPHPQPKKKLLTKEEKSPIKEEIKEENKVVDLAQRRDKNDKPD